MGMEIIDFKATKCKHCYKCVRYCDVKAIQVKDERLRHRPFTAVTGVRIPLGSLMPIWLNWQSS